MSDSSICSPTPSGQYPNPVSGWAHLPGAFAAKGGPTPKAPPSRILWALASCSGCRCSRRSAHRQADSTSEAPRLLRSPPTVPAEILPGHLARVQNFESTELTCWEQWGAMACGRHARPRRLRQSSWRRSPQRSPAHSAASGRSSILPGDPIPVPKTIPRISHLHVSPNLGFCFGGEAKLTSLSSGNGTSGRFCWQLLFKK